MTTHSIALGLALLAIASCCNPVQGEEVQVLFDGTQVEGWDVARDADRLKHEFSFSEVKAATQPDALVWRFVSRGVSFNDLFLRRPIARDFASIRVRLRNDGAAFALAAKVREASGAEWTTPHVRLVASNDWQWIEFARHDWQPASWSHDPDGRLDFPLAYFTLIAFGVEPGLDYRLRVARVEVVRPDPPVLTLHELQLPGALRAGQTGLGTLAFTLDKAGETDQADLVFRQDKTERFRLPLALPTPATRLGANQRVTLPDLALVVPLYAPGGTFSVGVEIGGARLADDANTGTITIQSRQPGKTAAEVRQHGGAPTLFINGRPHAGMAWATYGPTAEVFRDFTRAGVTLYTFSGTPTEAGYDLSRTTGRRRTSSIIRSSTRGCGSCWTSTRMPISSRASTCTRPSGGANGIRTTWCSPIPATANRAPSSTAVASPPPAGHPTLGDATRLRRCSV